MDVNCEAVFNVHHLLFRMCIVHFTGTRIYECNVPWKCTWSIMCHTKIGACIFSLVYFTIEFERNAQYEMASKLNFTQNRKWLQDVVCAQAKKYARRARALCDDMVWVEPCVRAHLCIILKKKKQKISLCISFLLRFWTKDGCHKRYL